MWRGVCSSSPFCSFAGVDQAADAEAAGRLADLAAEAQTSESKVYSISEGLCWGCDISVLAPSTQWVYADPIRSPKPPSNPRT